MAYSTDFRKQALKIKKEGKLSLKKCTQFGIGTATIIR